jgi:hypothetical protein
MLTNLHYYSTQGSGNSNYKKKCRGQKLPCRTKKSSTLLHHQVHSFMEHGVDPLVEIGGQQEATRNSYFMVVLEQPSPMARRTLNSIYHLLKSITCGTTNPMDHCPPTQDISISWRVSFYIGCMSISSLQQ